MHVCYHSLALLGCLFFCLPLCDHFCTLSLSVPSVHPPRLWDVTSLALSPALTCLLFTYPWFLPSPPAHSPLALALAPLSLHPCSITPRALSSRRQHDLLYGPAHPAAPLRCLPACSASVLLTGLLPSHGCLPHSVLCTLLSHFVSSAHYLSQPWLYLPCAQLPHGLSCRINVRSGTPHRGCRALCSGPLGHKELPTPHQVPDQALLDYNLCGSTKVCSSL